MRSLAAPFQLLFLCTVINIFLIAFVNPLEDNCTCGYYDSGTNSVFTDSIIVYFNETTSLPLPDFVTEAYTHDYEKGWTTQFREGANISNVGILNSSISPEESKSLELRVSPYQEDHLVVGSSLRTSRRDIQYGSFTALLRPPGPLAGMGGSALSMAVQYNSSQKITLDLQNKNQPSDAFVSMLHGDDNPRDSHGVPFESIATRDFGNGTITPWEYTEFRMDWTPEYVKFYIGGFLARTSLKSADTAMISTPSTFFLKHWSNGNAFSSQGPPTLSTTANVGWVRAFFNSSLMDSDDHVNLKNQCQSTDPCLSSDTTLRVSSTFSPAALSEWKQRPKHRPSHMFAIWLAVACITGSTLLLINAVWMRTRETITGHKKKDPSDQEEMRRNFTAMSAKNDLRAAAVARSASLALAVQVRKPSYGAHDSVKSFNMTESPSHAFEEGSFATKLRPKVHFQNPVPFGHATIEEEHDDLIERTLGDSVSIEESKSELRSHRKRHICADVTVGPDSGTTRRRPTTFSSKAYTINNGADHRRQQAIARREQSSRTLSLRKISGIAESPVSCSPDGSSSFAASKTSTNVADSQQRIDHLAGLLAICCIIVTAINFSLTFGFGILNAGAFQHYKSEETIRKSLSQILLNPIWIGPFFLTSSRFLVAGYLRTGDLLVIAEKAVGRTFRLMNPIAAMALLEYFLIGIQATKWLQYLPSITWSIWPYVIPYKTFGNIINEILELVYLIPNATPVIISNYCTGVLWTVPVQIQGSWTALLAVIVAYEIKSPWKKLAFYAFCIINHWYAVSWGTYFLFGVMLTDLEMSHNWRKHLHARSVIYYPVLIFCILLGMAALGLDIIAQWGKVNYVSAEYGIHPNPSTGLAISQGSEVYLPYYFPRINGIAFAVGIQAAIELSPLIQKLLSIRLLQRIFPHIFTIYLVHGFIFWSLGSWICVALAVYGLPYWSNILIVALCCYFVIGLSSPLLTPIVESLGKILSKDVWRIAHEVPLPRKPTLYPFPSGYLFNRYTTQRGRGGSQDVKIQNMRYPGW